MKFLNSFSALAAALASAASLSSCAIPTFWDDTDSEVWKDTYVRVDLAQDNEVRGLFQWYPGYELGVSYRRYEGSALAESQANMNYIVDDHIVSHSYDWERYLYYSGNWSNRLPLPVAAAERFDYACYAPYTSSSISDYDPEQSALCPAEGERAGQLFYRQGSDLSNPCDFIWASLCAMDSASVKSHIATGPLYFNAEHALAKVCFKVEGLRDRYHLRSIEVRPSEEGGALVQGWFDPFAGRWSADAGEAQPVQWSWSGIELSRSETCATTESRPIYLLPTYAGSSQASSIDYVLTLDEGDGQRAVSGSWSGKLEQNQTYEISISVASSSSRASSKPY